MKTRGLILAAAVWFLMLSLGLSGALSSPSSVRQTACASQASGKPVELQRLEMKVLSVYFWRDWMPIVEQPGPDHGSPLFAKVTLVVDNTAGGANTLSYKGRVIDENGQPCPATFDVQPDYNLLPKIVFESYPNLDEQGKKEVMAKYHAIWDGALAPGEVREVELISHDGPYLPVGSRVQVEFTFTDQQGGVVTVKTPSDIINRTD